MTHPFMIGHKVVCKKDHYTAYAGSIYTVYDRHTTSDNKHYVRFKEDYHKHWVPSCDCVLFKVPSVDPKVIYYLKEYRDKGNINNKEWEELKQLVAKLEPMQNDKEA